MKKNLANRENAENGGDKPEKESIPQLFGRNVRKYRKARSLTQEQLSERVGISQKHLSIVETGTQFASASLIERLCAELEVSPADLFGGSSDEIKSRLNDMEASLRFHVVNEVRRYNSILFKQIKALIENQKAPKQDDFWSGLGM